MSKSKSGARHRLVLYWHAMNRIWQHMLVLGLLAMAVGWWTLVPPTTILGFHSDLWLFALAVLSLGIAGYAFIARYFAYIQPHDAYLTVVTPLVRFRISYQRLRGIRPMLLQQIFPPESSSWARRSFISQFYGKTALVLELKGYPINPRLLRMFIPGELFYPQGEGLVLLVPDWMKFSTEMDSFFGAWQQTAHRGRLAHSS
ncbi:MAG: hypothetical protein ACKOC5_07840 [Chloroflexota bacterium]